MILEELMRELRRQYNEYYAKHAKYPVYVIIDTNSLQKIISELFLFQSKIPNVWRLHDMQIITLKTDVPMIRVVGSPEDELLT